MYTFLAYAWAERSLIETVGSLLHSLWGVMHCTDQAEEPAHEADQRVFHIFQKVATYSAGVLRPLCHRCLISQVPISKYQHCPFLYKLVFASSGLILQHLTLDCHCKYAAAIKGVHHPHRLLHS